MYLVQINNESEQVEVQRAKSQIKNAAGRAVGRRYPNNARDRCIRQRLENPVLIKDRPRESADRNELPVLIHKVGQTEDAIDVILRDLYWGCGSTSNLCSCHSWCRGGSRSRGTGCADEKCSG